MSGKGGGCPAPQDQQVWLLGNEHPSADRSIAWDADPFPDLADLDVLIIDLATLTEERLSRIDNENLTQVGKSIENKVLGGGTVVVITHHGLSVTPWDKSSGKPIVPPNGYSSVSRACSSYRILPVILKTVQTTSRSKTIEYGSHDFKEYLDGIRSFTFYIESWYSVSLLSRITPSRFKKIAGQDIKDKSKRDLGFTLMPNTAGDGSLPRPRSAGRLVFLPPPTEASNIAIRKILSVYGKPSLGREAPPAWANTLSLPKVDKMRKKILSLNERTSKILLEISDLKRQERVILDHCRLLYSMGPDLEDAVVLAFKALGFDDIVPMGGGDQEDAAFGIATGAGYSRGVVEVKGSGKGASVQAILQCKKWAAGRAAADGRATKGILVFNQFCLRPYPKSQDARVKFEDNQVRQAELDRVCIIPSCALFEAVRRVLGGEAPDRARIEAKIAATEGVLKDVF